MGKQEQLPAEEKQSEPEKKPWNKGRALLLAAALGIGAAGIFEYKRGQKAEEAQKIEKAERKRTHPIELGPLESEITEQVVVPSEKGYWVHIAQMHGRETVALTEATGFIDAIVDCQEKIEKLLIYAKKKYGVTEFRYEGLIDSDNFMLYAKNTDNNIHILKREGRMVELCTLLSEEVPSLRQQVASRKNYPEAIFIVLLYYLQCRIKESLDTIGPSMNAASSQELNGAYNRLRQTYEELGRDKLLSKKALYGVAGASLKLWAEGEISLTYGEDPGPFTALHKLIDGRTELKPEEVREMIRLNQERELSAIRFGKNDLSDGREFSWTVFGGDHDFRDQGTSQGVGVIKLQPTFLAGFLKDEGMKQMEELLRDK